MKQGQMESREMDPRFVFETGMLDNTQHSPALFRWDASVTSPEACCDEDIFEAGL